MKVIIRDNAKECGLWAAHYIAAKIKEKAARTSEPFVLGLPTGSSPLGMYKALIELNKAGKVSFRNVVTFILTLCAYHPRRAQHKGREEDFFHNYYLLTIHY